MPPCLHPCWMCLSSSAGWTKPVIAIHCFSTIKHQSKSQSNKLGNITETALMELCIPLTLPKRPCHLPRRSFAFTQKGSAAQRYPKDASRTRKEALVKWNEKLRSNNRQITLHAFSVFPSHIYIFELKLFSACKLCFNTRWFINYKKVQRSVPVSPNASSLTHDE